MGSFGPSMSGGHATRSMERTSRNPSRSISADLTQKKPKPPLKKVWPQVMKLVKPRLPLLAVSLLVLIINRACGLVLPASTKYLIDDVMRQHHAALLPRIVGFVVTATILQGVTTFA